VKQTSRRVPSPSNLSVATSSGGGRPLIAPPSTEPGYYVNIAVPFRDEQGRWWHDRAWAGPVAVAGDLVDALAFGLRQLRDELDPDEPPWWHAFVVREDGSRRPATEAENAALVASLEQAYPRAIVQLRSGEERA
jgi:hypothetical protein